MIMEAIYIEKVVAKDIKRNGTWFLAVRRTNEVKSVTMKSAAKFGDALFDKSRTLIDKKEQLQKS